MLTTMKRIIIIMAAVLITLAAAGKTYVVAAGINDYPGVNMDLNLCANDAKSMKQIYMKHGDVEVALLLDAQATTENVSKTMTQLFSKATANDAIVFFYSGHGSTTGFRLYNAVLTHKNIIKLMSKSKAIRKMIFADACHSGGLRVATSSSASTTSTSSLTNADISRYNKLNVLFFLSSRDAEVSFENNKMSNGFFTAYLERGLRGAADANKDRDITAKELFVYVSNGVQKLSKGKQHPVMWGKFDDNMSILRW